MWSTQMLHAEAATHKLAVLRANSEAGKEHGTVDYRFRLHGAKRKSSSQGRAVVSPARVFSACVTLGCTVQ